MSFLTMQQEVASLCKMDLTDTSHLTLIKRWLNIAQEDINSRASWPWLEGREIVQTVAEVTTGTVAITAGGTTVTGTGTAFSSANVGSYIQFSTSDDWYKISSVAAADSLVIEAAYTGTTDLTAGTYTIRKVYYSLSNSVDKVLSIRQSIGPVKLITVHYRDMDQYHPNITSTGDPEVCIMFGMDSSKNWQFYLSPIPDEAINLEVRAKFRTTDLSADDDVSMIPQKWANTILVAGAIWRGMEFNRVSREDVRADKWMAVYERGIERMMAEESVSEDRHGVVQSIESMGRTHEIPFPSDYEP